MTLVVYTLLLFLLVILFINVTATKKQKKLKTLIQNQWGKAKIEEPFNFDFIERYFVNNVKEKTCFHLISESSIHDLDFHEIFKFIDRTTSKIGQQYLYYKLRNISSHKDLLIFNNLVTTFSKNNDLTLDCQIALQKLSGFKTYYLENLISKQHPKKPTYFWAILLMALAPVLIIIISIINIKCLLLLCPVFFINAVIHYKNKNNISSYLLGVAELNKAISTAQLLSKRNELSSHFSDFGFLNNLLKIRQRAILINLESQLEGEFMMIFWAILELIKIIFNLESILFVSFVRLIVEQKESLRTLFEYIGELDSAISVASLRNDSLPTCQPSFENTKTIQIKDLIHPLIVNCVPNSIDLKDKSMLLTGSNMSGKTTFIRTLSINSILAQTIFTCFATSYNAPFWKLYSSIRITDSLADKTSYYLEEVLTIKEFIEASKEQGNCLFVLDEILKGTNTIERISTAKAILSFLNTTNHHVFVSTHDIELANLLQEKNYALYHFCEEVSENGVFFDHKLKIGELTKRNAISIMEYYDYPSEIITDARNTEKTFFSKS